MSRKVSILTLVLLFCSAFSFLSMGKVIDGEIVRDTPANEESENCGWTWINDEVCSQFNLVEDINRDILQRKYDMGLLSQWAEPTNDGRGTWKAKKRDTYAGKWSQSEDGIWSFVFEDCTIPIGVTKIDGVLYAFNGYGELKEGYEYYEGITTAADGLANSNNPDFLKWLETQYVPECTTTKTK